MKSKEPIGIDCNTLVNPALCILPKLKLCNKGLAAAIEQSKASGHHLN